MRFRHVLGYEVAWALVYLLFLTYNPDTSSTTGTCWFHDVHVLVITHLSFIAPTLVVFWEQVSRRADLEVFSVPSPLALHVSPEVTFVTNVPGTSKMIQFLMRVHVLQLAWPY